MQQREEGAAEGGGCSRGRRVQREEGATEGGGCSRGRRGAAEGGGVQQREEGAAEGGGVQQRKDGCSRGMSVMVEARQSNVCASVAKREDYRLYCLYFFHLLLHQNIFHPHKGGTH